jgi:hypothetical protein
MDGLRIVDSSGGCGPIFGGIVCGKNETLKALAYATGSVGKFGGRCHGGVRDQAQSYDRVAADRRRFFCAGEHYLRGNSSVCVSDTGNNDTTSLDKEILAVVTVKFQLD